MADVLSTFSTRRTPQSQPARADQIPNSAGGHTFKVGLATRVRRFLILGSDGGTFYVQAKDLTRENARAVVELAETNHAVLVDVIREVSLAGLAPRQQPTLFALAIASSVGTAEERREALAALPVVARTGTHLLTFARYVEQFRGWGRGLRDGVSAWYTSRAADVTAYQVVKYRSRDGWSHRDLLRLAHPRTNDPAMRGLFDWVCRGDIGDHVPALVTGWQAVQSANTAKAAAEEIRRYRLTWEMVPDVWINEPVVWEALFDVGVPIGALIRQLPRLTRIGFLADRARVNGVTARLTDVGKLKAGRVHPMNLLVAQRTYSAGRSDRGSSMWTPVQRVVDALDEAFYLAYGAVEPAGKRTLVGLDVSGSMSMSRIMGMPLTAREAGAALTMVTLATEPDTAVYGFTGGGFLGGGGRRRYFGMGCGIEPLAISPRRRLDDVIRYTEKLPMGGTDCALPMLLATKNKLKVDTFLIITDNESWEGDVHPHQALEEYRQKSGIDARLVVAAMSATDFSVADPRDPRQLDVVGMDGSVPNLISAFSRGDV